MKYLLYFIFLCGRIITKYIEGDIMDRNMSYLKIISYLLILLFFALVLLSTTVSESYNSSFDINLLFD